MISIFNENDVAITDCRQEGNKIDSGYRRLNMKVRGSAQYSSKTGNYVRRRDMGSEASAREEVGYDGGEYVAKDVWSHEAGYNKKRGTTEIEAISQRVGPLQQRMLK